MQSSQMKEIISKLEIQHKQREDELMEQIRKQQLEIERLKANH